MFINKNMLTSNIQTSQVIFRNIHVYMLITIIKEKRACRFEREQRGLSGRFWK